MSDNNTIKRQLLVGTIKADTVEVPIIGSMVWWNAKNVSIAQDQFSALLESVGLNPKYARDHNYRSAFIRAITALKEQRIIRQVEETGNKIIYQFTSEVKVDSDTGTTSELRYDKETLIVIDKSIYWRTQDISQAIIEGRDDIKEQVVTLFNNARVTYNSSDITRYLQKILMDNADIVSIRDQGAVYFIPVGFTEVKNKVANLVNQIDGMSFEEAPMVDMAQCRKMVGNAVHDELTEAFIKVAADIKATMAMQDTIKPEWATAKLKKVREVMARVESYASVLDAKANPLITDLKALEMAIMRPRTIDIEVESPAEPVSA